LLQNLKVGKIVKNCKKWETLLTKYVMHYRAFGGNKVQIVSFNGISCGDIGVINVYAPKTQLKEGICRSF
jgi:hypothetical protein